MISEPRTVESRLGYRPGHLDQPIVNWRRTEVRNTDRDPYGIGSAQASVHGDWVAFNVSLAISVLMISFAPAPTSWILASRYILDTLVSAMQP